MADEDAVEAVRVRIRYYGDQGAVAPVPAEAFEFLYAALNKNLREALSTAQEFSHWMAQEYPSRSDLPNETERKSLLEIWLAERAGEAFKDARSVQPRHWQFFEELCSQGGRTGSADFARFGFGRQQQMVAAVTALANTRLMEREVDPDDGTRTVNSVTALGWLVHFHRSGFAMPPSRIET